MSPVGTPFANATAAPSETPVDEAPTSTDAEATPDDAPKAAKKAEPRDYKVMTTVSGTHDKVKAAIDALPGDAKIEVYIVHGKANALQPKLALQNYAKAIEGELNGKYVLAADGAFKQFTVDSKPVTKHQVKIS